MIQLNPTIDALFDSRNINNDCDKIANLLQPVDRDIAKLLTSGCAKEAVDMYLQVLLSLSNHFIADEHWSHFDDYYSPDYICQHTFERFYALIEKDLLPNDAKKHLYEGMKEIEKMESVQNYSTPDVYVFLRKMKKWISPII